MANMDCHCEDNDDECWEDCALIPDFSEKNTCEYCEETDLQCWENCLNENRRKKRSDGDECGCEDWDKECWKYCLVSTIGDAKETEGTAQFIDVAFFLPKVLRILGNIYGEFASDYALENSEFEGEPECECKDGDDDCWLYCLESTITIANLDDYETAQDFSSLFPQIF